MTDMRLVVVGAAGRMGRTLVRIIAETDGVTLAGAIEREGAPEIGKDAGLLAGVGDLGVALTTDPLPVFAKADGVLDFTIPAATLGFTELAAQARIAHIIGTTGLSADDDKKIAAAARHAPIVKSGNMSLGVNLLAVLVKQAAKALDAGFRHRGGGDAPPRQDRRAFGHGADARPRRGGGTRHRPRPAFGARARRHHRSPPARRYRLCVAEGRIGGRRAQRDPSPAKARPSS